MDSFPGAFSGRPPLARFRSSIRSRLLRSLRDADASSFRFLSSEPGPLNFVRGTPVEGPIVPDDRLWHVDPGVTWNYACRDADGRTGFSASSVPGLDVTAQ
jgi:hypothetical protein